MSAGSPAGAHSAPPSPPTPAHDPIAIAALIAELPELEQKFLAAMKVAEEAKKALDVIQDRIDWAINALRSKAPHGSKWKTASKCEITQQGLQQLYARAQNMQDAADNDKQNKIMALAHQIANQENQAKIAPPPMIKRGGPQ